MYAVTLEINKKCNLNCTYCYLGKKEAAEMSFEDAKDIILVILKEVEKKHEDKSLKINFLGGEPLLSISLIQKLVQFCNVQVIERNIKIIYTITTNGTIMNHEIMNFYVSKIIGEFRLSL